MKFNIFIEELNNFVLARYIDGKIYRARLLAIQGRKYEVFYLDYGNVDCVDDLYEWDPICNQVPLQAVVLKMYGVIELVQFLCVQYQRETTSMARLVQQQLCKYVSVKLKAYIEWVDSISEKK